MNEAERKAILVAIFKRRGANGRWTRLFDDLEVGQKDALLRHVHLSDGESPIIGGVERLDRWFILTTHRIVWCAGQDVVTLPVDEIVDANIDLEKLKKEGSTKLTLRELQIETRTAKHTINLEPGPPLSGVWNVLQNIGSRNRRRPEGSGGGAGSYGQPVRR